MRIDVVTLFAELFEGPLSLGLVGRAIAQGGATVGFVDPRDFTSDRHRTVDDTPYGGGGGMVMKPEPLAAALDEARSRGGGPAVLMTPQGRPLAQDDLVRWSGLAHLVLVSGRYEGFDERIRERVDDEVSLGDFVLTGGEYAALAIIDGVIRLLPGTLGNASSPEQDSFRDGLLEHPHYTRPLEFEGRRVPDVLTSGDHGRVEAWRRAESLSRTRRRRPDLLERAALSASDRRSLWRAPEASRLEVAVGLSRVPTEAALTALARIAATYGLSRIQLVAGALETPVAEAVARAPEHAVALPDPRPKRQRGRGPAPSVLVSPPELLEVTSTWSATATGDVCWLGADPGVSSRPVVPPGALAKPPPRGTRWGLALGAGLDGPPPFLSGVLPSVRPDRPDNDLPLAAALPVLLDRIWASARVFA